MEDTKFSTALFRSLEQFSVNSNTSSDSEPFNKPETSNICLEYASETFLGFDNIDLKSVSEETTVDLTKSDCEIGNNHLEFDKKLCYPILNVDNRSKIERDDIGILNKQIFERLLHNKEEIKKSNAISNSDSVPFLNNLRLQCDICCKKFDSSIKLSRHNCKGVSNACKFCKKTLRKQFCLQNDTVRVCTLCNKEFASLRLFFRHFRVHSTEGRNVKCPRCKKNYFNEDNFDFVDDLKIDQLNESVAVFKNNKFNICNEEFETDFIREKHNVKLNKASVYIKKEPSDNLNAVFNCFKTKLKGHLSLKTDFESSFICDQCGELFSKESELVTHLKSTHLLPESKKFCCHKCGKLFSKKWTLKVHLRSHYGDTKYKCETCCKTFGRKDSLTRHKILHADRKPHSCSVCRKSFTERAKLVLHYRVHTGEKPFSCEHCGRNFSANSDLKRHILRKHSSQIGQNLTILQSDLMFFCDLCGKSFGMKSSLRAHIKVHSGIKPFECSECGKAFNRNWNMKSHARTHKKTSNCTDT